MRPARIAARSGLKGDNPAAIEVDINKIRTMRLFHQVLARKGGLAGPVRPSNDHDPLFIGHVTRAKYWRVFGLCLDSA